MQISFFTIRTAWAQTVVPTPTASSLQDFYDIVRAAAQWVLVFGIILGVIFVALGGIKILTSGGDEQKLRSGKATLMWALVGIAILVLAFSLVNLVAQFLGTSGPIIAP